MVRWAREGGGCGRCLDMTGKFSFSFSFFFFGNSTISRWMRDDISRKGLLINIVGIS